jgi:hypothetical protein
METRRFDELTVALARGGSRRGVLRGLVAGVLGALAVDQSGALAKNDKNPELETKPICPGGSGDSGACPLCYQAASDCCQGQPTRSRLYNVACEGINPGTTENPDGNSCVTADCELVNGKWRCRYTADHSQCPTSGNVFCCRRYESTNFGQCVANKNAC